MNSTEQNKANGADGANAAPSASQKAAGDAAMNTANHTINPDHSTSGQVNAGFNPDAVSQEGKQDDEALVDHNAELSQLREALAKAEQQIANEQDQSLRLKADLENQRRRMQKQVDDAHKYSVQRFVESLLPVIDSLEMGLQAQGDLEKIREGMGLTLKQFESVMEKFSIEGINPEGEMFDPNRHQAVSQVASDAHENNQVIFVMQKGYMLSGRVVRPAMVTVCKK